MAHGERNESLWMHTPFPRGSAPPRGEASADVVVVGAGITGLTTAFLLQRAGKQVVLLEMRRGAGSDTGRTTSHCTAVLDVRYADLRKHLGDEAARRVASAAWEVLDTLDVLAAEHAPGSYVRQPMHLVTEVRRHERELERELEAMQRLGLPTARLVREGLPYPQARLGLRLEHQGQLEPRAYLAGLLRAFLAAGGRFHEGARVDHVKDGTPCSVFLEGATLHAGAVVLATHVPLQSFLLIPKLPQSRTYVVATEVGPGFPEGLVYDTADPYHYVRLQQHVDGRVAIIGGEDHRVGTRNDGRDREEALLHWARARFPIGRVLHRWSGQIVEPVDGLPLVGRNALDHHVYVATGYAGNGITWGTVAAHLLADLVLGRDNPLAAVFHPGRVNRAQLPRLVTENVAYPTYLVKDWLRPADARALEEVPVGEGRIVRVQGRRTAVSRDAEGRYLAVSPVCTHMGCHVHWNSTERSWDCPCHGSRFEPNGQVLNGPAPRGLAARPLPPGVPLSPQAAPARRAPEAPLDALALLEAQHRQVEDLFEQYHQLEEEAGEERRQRFVQLAEALSAHLDVVEHTFAPAVMRVRRLERLREALRGHRHLRRRLTELRALDVGEPGFGARLEQLHDEVEHHVREEEDRLFPQVRRLLDAEQLAELGWQMRAALEARARRGPGAPQPPEAGAPA